MSSSFGIQHCCCCIHTVRWRTAPCSWTWALLRLPPRAYAISAIGRGLRPTFDYFRRQRLLSFACGAALKGGGVRVNRVDPALVRTHSASENRRDRLLALSFPPTPGPPVFAPPAGCQQPCAVGSSLVPAAACTHNRACQENPENLRMHAVAGWLLFFIFYFLTTGCVSLILLYPFFALGCRRQTRPTFGTVVNLPQAVLTRRP